MKTLAKLLGIVLLLGAAFAGGAVWRAWSGTKKADVKVPLYYVDPMHPWYKSDKPGIAPDCGMKLEPVYATPETAAGATSSSSADILIDPGKQQLMGITFGNPEMTALMDNVRAVGKVAVDETRVERVHSKVEGWIEKTFVNYTGQLVEKGQPLLTIYSPELLATQQELLLAMKARESLHHSSIESMHGSGEPLVEAARRRLSLWDLSDLQLAQVEKTGQPIKSVTLFSPASGYVMERKAFPNQKIGPEMKLYTIADLSRVWVFADIYEVDAPSIRVGTGARVSVDGSGRSYAAKVTEIQPVVEGATRTLKARLELPNPGFTLKPEMYVDVEFFTGGGSRLTVPAEAVIDSGTSQTVYVDAGGGSIEPRSVQIGARTGDRIEIVRGLKQADRIVTSGAFLLNSESQMRSAVGSGEHRHD